MATAHIRPNRRSAEDRRRQILEAATELFASQGFKGTTTRQLAERAQVNEAIIFRHFSSKEDLYWAVLEHQCEQSALRKVIAGYLAGDAPAEETFVGLARAFLQFRQQDPSFVRLLLYSALDHHKLSQRFFQTHIAEFYEETAQYIRRRIRTGEFRAVDPLMAARGFWGMVVYHFLAQELFGGKHFQDFELGEASRVIADLWLQGMLSCKAEPAGKSRKKKA